MKSFIYGIIRGIISILLLLGLTATAYAATPIKKVIPMEMAGVISRADDENIKYIGIDSVVIETSRIIPIPGHVGYKSYVVDQAFVECGKVASTWSYGWVSGWDMKIELGKLIPERQDLLFVRCTYTRQREN